MTLFDAIRSGSLTNVELLLEQDPNLVNITDPKGFSPLVLSTYLGFGDIAKALIDAGADVNLQDKVGNTALMGVCFKGNIAMIEMLLDAGADINILNQNNGSALIFAASFGQEEAVRYLIDKGVIFIQGQTGRNALDYARAKNGIRGRNLLSISSLDDK